jgi:hypothetical protein
VYRAIRRIDLGRQDARSLRDRELSPCRKEQRYGKSYLPFTFLTRGTIANAMQKSCVAESSLIRSKNSISLARERARNQRACFYCFEYASRVWHRASFFTPRGHLNYINYSHGDGHALRAETMTGSPFGPAGLSHGGAFQVGSLPVAHAISGGEWARAILNARIVHAGKEVHRAPVNPCPGCRNSIRTYAVEMAISFATGRGIVNQIRDAMNTVVGPASCAPALPRLFLQVGDVRARR